MVTVGMNYEVRPGKNEAFEQVFEKVVEIMQSLDGHQDTQLYRAVKNPQSYLIVSRWSDRGAFEAFTKSERFLKVADWGKEQILAARPTHEVYGADDATQKAGGGCPVAH